MKKENLWDWVEAFASGMRGIMQNYEVMNAERKYGCDFGGHLLKGELGYEDGQGYDYTPSFNHPKKYCTFTRVKNDDIVMDLGCGKGYAMYLLGKYPFKKVYGIEKNHKLAEIATHNCSKLNDYERYMVIAEDVLEAFSSEKSKDLIDSTSIFYIYNSFPRNIMQKVILGIERSAHEKARDVTLWYAQPDKECLEVVNDRVRDGAWKCTKQQKHLGQNIYEFKFVSKS